MRRDGGPAGRGAGTACNRSAHTLDVAGRHRTGEGYDSFSRSERSNRFRGVGAEAAGPSPARDPAAVRGRPCRRNLAPKVESLLPCLRPSAKTTARGGELKIMPDQVDWRTMEREASPGRAVGRLLRDQREARGLSIKAVEMALRIRLPYLEAIEQGRFDLLPGAAYIPAFLRAYALHVGLDPEKVLTAYQLSGAVPIKRPVALPADFPLAEKRAPIGLAVLTVLLVIGAGYAVWHYLPRQQSIVAEKVPPVPDRLLASRPATVEQPTAPTLPAATTQAAVPASTRIPGALPAETWPAPRHELPPAPPPAVVAVPAPPPLVVMSVPSVGQAQAAQPPSPEPVRTAPTPTPVG